MYIEARLIGLATYIITLLAFTLIMEKSTEKNRIIALLGYLLILFAMAFNYVPPEGQDLYRLIPRMHFYTQLSWSEFVQYLRIGSEPLTNLYYRIIGSIGIDGLLPGITVLIVYFFCFKILTNCAKMMDSDKYYVGLAFYFLMARGFFGTAISNIRTLLAISLIAYGFYKEFICNNSIIKSLPYYVIASLFHVMGIVLFIIRLTYLLVENVGTLSKKIRNLLILAIIAGGIYVVGERFINAFISKANNYTNGEDFFYIWEFLLTIMSLVVTVYMIKLHRKSIHMVSCQEDTYLCEGAVSKRLSNFMIYIVLFEIAFAFLEYSVFFRTGFVLSILNVPLYLSIVHNMGKSKDYKNMRIVSNNLKILFTIILLVECARGNLCSLKFFE